MKFFARPMFLPIRIADVELSQWPPSFGDLSNYGAIKALVRLHGSPLGYIDLKVTNGHCSIAALGEAILKQHTWMIVRHLIEDGLTTTLPTEGLRLTDLMKISHPMYAGPYPLVTVVVCTRNRVKDL